MTETATEVIYCSGCGDEVAAVDERSKCGPCCHNLPRPWSRTSEGLFVGTPGEEDVYDDEEEDESPTPPECRNCGRHVFDVVGAQQIDASEYEGHDDTILYHDPWQGEFTITCAHCGTEAQHVYLEAS